MRRREETGGRPENSRAAGREFRFPLSSRPQYLGTRLQICDRESGLRSWWRSANSSESFLIGRQKAEVAGEKIGVGRQILGSTNVDFFPDNQLGKVGGASDLAVGLENPRCNLDLAISPRAVFGDGGAHCLFPKKHPGCYSNGIRVDGEPALINLGIKSVFNFWMGFPERKHEPLDFGGFGITGDWKLDDRKFALGVGCDNLLELAVQLAAEPAGIISQRNNRMAGVGGTDYRKAFGVQEKLATVQGDEIVLILASSSITERSLL